MSASNADRRFVEERKRLPDDSGKGSHTQFRRPLNDSHRKYRRKSQSPEGEDARKGALSGDKDDDTFTDKIASRRAAIEVRGSRDEDWECPQDASSRPLDHHKRNGRDVDSLGVSRPDNNRHSHERRDPRSSRVLDTERRGQDSSRNGHSAYKDRSTSSSRDYYDRDRSRGSRDYYGDKHHGSRNDEGYARRDRASDGDKYESRSRGSNHERRAEGATGDRHGRGKDELQREEDGEAGDRRADRGCNDPTSPGRSKYERRDLASRHAESGTDGLDEMLGKGDSKGTGVGQETGSAKRKEVDDHELQLPEGQRRRQDEPEPMKQVKYEEEGTAASPAEKVDKAPQDVKGEGVAVGTSQDGEGKAKPSKASKWGPPADQAPQQQPPPVPSLQSLQGMPAFQTPAPQLAALLAARKAAELVNASMGVPGSMSADEKKRLLWGSKKAVVEEPVAAAAGVNRWDTVHFGDKDRDEKFQKLMGVKGEAAPGAVPAEGGSEVANETFGEQKQKELQEDLERQFAVGLRRRDGRTVGLGL